jgi:hypothetical protein
MFVCDSRRKKDHGRALSVFNLQLHTLALTLQLICCPLCCCNCLVLCVCAFRRKKDHGRAEALLIAAWGCGWSAEQPPGSRKTGSGSSCKGGSKSGSATLRQGALRDVVQMDEGVHLLASSSSAAEGAGSGDHDEEDGANAALFVPAGAAVQKKKAPAKAKQQAKAPKAAPRKKKQDKQAAGSAEDHDHPDASLSAAAAAAVQQLEEQSDTGFGSLGNHPAKASRKKRTAAQQEP